jgi:energy-coupling factor transporter ATP-binding protein EcfA2
MDMRVRTNPFPGLRPFAQEETDLFFGRDRQSDALLRRLGKSRFLAVVGTSGSGKSSLVRAGLLPALEGGFLAAAGSHWRIALMRPQDNPISYLAQALVDTAAFARLGLEPSAACSVVDTALRRSSQGLVEALRLAGLETHENVLVVVDQFEEIFRFADLAKRHGGGDEAPAFIKLLLAAAQQSAVKIYVVITMRSDFLGDCARFRDLPEAINEGQYLIPRLTRDEVQRAITGPIGVRGAQIAPRLVQRLLNDIGDDMDQLPILQHALMRTWDHWEQSVVSPPNAPNAPNARSLDLEDYEAVGGMARALSLHADEALNSLTEVGDQAVAEKIFKCLTERGADNREIRRPTALKQLCEIAAAASEQVARVIEAFRAPGRSFLMPPAGAALADDTVIDIAHESLIRQWHRLRTWVTQEAESHAVYARLVAAALLHQDGKASLWRDPEVKLARKWQEQNLPNQAWANQYYPGFDAAIEFLHQSEQSQAQELIKESRRFDAEQQAKQRELEQAKQLAAEQRQRAEEQERATRKQRHFTWGLALIAVAAFAGGIYGLVQKHNAERAKDIAVRAKLAANDAEDTATKALAASERDKALLVKSLEGETRQRAEAESARRAALEEKKRADEAAQMAEARLATINAVIDSVPDPALRDKLRERHVPGSVKTLTTSQQTRRASELASRLGPDKAQARSPAQYGLKLWANGATLRVRFLDGKPRQHEAVKRIAQLWTEHANLHFDYSGAKDAELRISFDANGGSWAYVGTDALGIPQSEPTMNLGAPDDASILHEFGHVLGLIHENNSPNAKLPWNKKVVYAEMQGPPNHWAKATVDYNLFREEKGIVYRPFDADSIMMYAYSASWFTDHNARGGKQVLSPSDQEFVRKLYPRGPG